MSRAIVRPDSWQAFVGSICADEACGATWRLGEPLPGERAQTLAHLVWGGDEERAQLVEGGGARLHGAATLEQEQTQILAPTTSAWKALALAGR